MSELTRENFIDNFNAQMQAWIDSQHTIAPTQTISGSAQVWNGQVATQRNSTINNKRTISYNNNLSNIMANSSSQGGAPNATASADPDPSAVLDELVFFDKVDDIDAVAQITTMLKNLMGKFAKTHRVTYYNTGNISVSIPSGVITTSHVPSSITNNINADIDSKVGSMLMQDGSILDPVAFQQLIDVCKDTWSSRCRDAGNLQTYRFRFCHNSCHSNVTCYNSRGRR